MPSGQPIPKSTINRIAKLARETNDEGAPAHSSSSIARNLDLAHTTVGRILRKLYCDQSSELAKLRRVVKKHGIQICLAVVLACSFGGELLATDMFDSTVQISYQMSATEGSIGTGSCFAETDTTVDVLTNAHVVGSQRSVTVDFWAYGRPSGRSKGQVVLRDPRGSNDMAIVRVDKTRLKYPPTIVPLAPRGTDVPVGSWIATCGCPKGAWPSMFRGHVLKMDEVAIEFQPIPAQGRSGSAIVTPDGRYQIGLLYGQNLGDQRDPRTGKLMPVSGRAMSLDAIYRVLDGDKPLVPMTRTAYSPLDTKVKWMRCPHGSQLFGCAECCGDDAFAQPKPPIKESQAELVQICSRCGFPILRRLRSRLRGCT